ncbi:MAG TPA: ATP-dependent DNA helicase RecQ [Bryobacteraceae bacterium]|nr:ATP-dependent DNA helicase RecQ [Bryobacteraceae bacterium]
MDLQATLREYWGYDGFRPKQREIAESILEGRDVAVVMPTGGGKSLCYQLPAVASGRLCVVVSPLIALMQDQASQLAQLGVPAAVLNSSQDAEERKEVFRRLYRGELRLLYLSPERLAAANTTDWLRQCRPAYFAVDEAHCISEWGHEFRPEYRQLRLLRDHFPDAPIAAFTASATRKVRHDILAQLHLREPRTFITSFARRNLRYYVRESARREKEQLLLRAVRRHRGESVIVYGSTIRAVEETAELLNQRGIPALHYHGKLDAETRRTHQERWMNGEADVMVGTLAFGLGINKPDVRCVIHLSLPKSPEQYYQEAGRAGRDGQAADCILLWSRADIGVLVHFIDQMEDAANKDAAWQRYHAVKEMVEGNGCRMRSICEYFGETPKAWERCGDCDACAGLPEWMERDDARQVVAAGGVSEGQLGAMKAWRKDFARRQKVAPYVILHDRTLSELLARRPATLEELLLIPGIGPQKVKKFGEEILEALFTAQESS